MDMLAAPASAVTGAVDLLEDVELSAQEAQEQPQAPLPLQAPSSDPGKETVTGERQPEQAEASQAPVQNEGTHEMDLSPGCDLKSGTAHPLMRFGAQVRVGGNAFRLCADVCLRGCPQSAATLRLKHCPTVQNPAHVEDPTPLHDPIHYLQTGIIFADLLCC